jgi:hypothetical protein
VQLLAKAIGQHHSLTPDLLVHATELTQLHQLRFPNLHPTKTLLISPDRIGQHSRVPTVVLRSSYRVTVSKSIKLSRINRENRNLSLKQCLDNRSPRHLDRYSNASALRELEQLLSQCNELSATVFHRPFAKHAAPTI